MVLHLLQIAFMAAQSLLQKALLPTPRAALKPRVPCSTPVVCFHAISALIFFRFTVMIFFRFTVNTDIAFVCAEFVQVKHARNPPNLALRTYHYVAIADASKLTERMIQRMWNFHSHLEMHVNHLEKHGHDLCILDVNMVRDF